MFLVGAAPRPQHGTATAHQGAGRSLLSTSVLLLYIAEAVDGGAKASACEASVGLVTTAEAGFLAGLTVAETPRVGTSDCPWVVRAPAGRRVNLTLFNFAGAAAAAGEMGRRPAESLGCPLGTGRYSYIYGWLGSRVVSVLD